MDHAANSQQTGGILKTVSACRFRLILLNAGFNFDYFTQQIYSVNCDFLNNLINIYLQHPAVSGFHSQINQLCKSNSFDLSLESVGTSQEKIQSLEFINCYVNNHKLEFTYEKNECLMHNLEFKYSILQEQ